MLVLSHKDDAEPSPEKDYDLGIPAAAATPFEVGRSLRACVASSLVPLFPVASPLLLGMGLKSSNRRAARASLKRPVLLSL